MAIRGKKIGAEKEKAELRKYDSLELRLQGKSYREIGKAQDISEAQAHRDVAAALKIIIDDRKEDINEQRQIELERLDTYIDSLEWKKNVGDLKTIDLLVKIQARRAKLLGLDAPVKLAHTDPSGDSPVEINVKIVE